jgi:hypothetical protein
MTLRIALTYQAADSFTECEVNLEVDLERLNRYFGYFCRIQRRLKYVSFMLVTTKQIELWMYNLLAENWSTVENMQISIIWIDAGHTSWKIDFPPSFLEFGSVSIDDDVSKFRKLVRELVTVITSLRGPYPWSQFPSSRFWIGTTWMGAT